MKQTVVARLIKAIEIAYKEHLPEWEFPNKEIWIQEEKEQMIDFTMDFMGEDNGHESYRRHSALDLFNKTFNINEK
jgi:hypothetical protein